jgi:hypothetical protein
MKKRSSFVSNSSSASFIIIGSGKIEKPDIIDSVLRVPGDLGGETEFGWGPEDVSDIGSRINFAYLQSQYKNGPDEPLYQKAAQAVGEETNPWLALLEQVIKDVIGVDTIEWNITSDWSGGYSGYIDHQSSAGQGENIEMFDSYDAMKSFLFAEDSYIHLDNDNH